MASGASCSCSGLGLPFFWAVVRDADAKGLGQIESIAHLGGVILLDGVEWQRYRSPQDRRWAQGRRCCDRRRAEIPAS